MSLTSIASKINQVVTRAAIAKVLVFSLCAFTVYSGGIITTFVMNVLGVPTGDVAIGAPDGGVYGTSSLTTLYDGGSTLYSAGTVFGAPATVPGEYVTAAQVCPNVEPDGGGCPVGGGEGYWYDAGSGGTQTAGGAVVINAAGDVNAGNIALSNGTLGFPLIAPQAGLENTGLSTCGNSVFCNNYTDMLENPWPDAGSWGQLQLFMVHNPTQYEAVDLALFAQAWTGIPGASAIAADVSADAGYTYVFTLRRGNPYNGTSGILFDLLPSGQVDGQPATTLTQLTTAAQVCPNVQPDGGGCATGGGGDVSGAGTAPQVTLWEPDGGLGGSSSLTFLGGVLSILENSASVQGMSLTNTNASGCSAFQMTNDGPSTGEFGVCGTTYGTAPYANAAWFYTPPAMTGGFVAATSGNAFSISTLNSGHTTDPATFALTVDGRTTDPGVCHLLANGAWGGTCASGVAATRTITYGGASFTNSLGSGDIGGAVPWVLGGQVSALCYSLPVVGGAGSFTLGSLDGTAGTNCTTAVLNCASTTSHTCFFVADGGLTGTGCSVATGDVTAARILSSTCTATNPEFDVAITGVY